MFKPSFVHAYKSSKSKLPIETWCKVVGQNLPQFTSPEDIYNPVVVYVKIAGDVATVNGTIKMSVSSVDENWYSDLTSALSEMTKTPNVRVVNMLGQPINHMTPAQLAKAGECDIIDNKGKLVRLDAVVPIPPKYATNKIYQLKNWWNDNSEKLTAHVAKALKGKTMSEIAVATKADGLLQKEIESFLVANTIDHLSWPSFVKTYGNHNTTPSKMAMKLLESVKTCLRANELKIKNYHASINSDVNLWSSEPVRQKYKDDFTLYRDIIGDAITHGLVRQEMIQAILYGTIGCISCGGRKKKEKKSKSQINPLNLYYQKHHYTNFEGKLPGHVIEKYNKNISSGISNSYPGNPQAAVNTFNLLTGRALDPVNGIADWYYRKQQHKQTDKTVNVNVQMTKQKGIFRDKYKGSDGQTYVLTSPDNASHLYKGQYFKLASDIQIGEEVELPRLVPIGDPTKFPRSEQMPRLVPIGEETELPKLVPIGDPTKFPRSDQMPRLVPIGEETEFPIGDTLKMPRLVPIGEESELPRLVPIGDATQMPRLVPIGDTTKIPRSDQMPRLVPIGNPTQMPRLVPIGEETELPRLVPIGDSPKMPRLIPIGEEAELPRLVPMETKKPSLVPIDKNFRRDKATVIPSREQLNQNVWSSDWKDDLPNLSDFLRN